MDATPIRTRLAEGTAAFRLRHAGLLHAIAVLRQRIDGVTRELTRIHGEIADVESRLRRAPEPAGNIPPWVEVVVLLAVAVCEWPITYTAAQGFLLSPAMTRLVAVPLAALPPVMGYLLARENERRHRNEEHELTLLMGVGITVYSLLTWALRCNYYAESGAHYALPGAVVAAIMTAVSLLGLLVTFVVGSRVDRSGAPALRARKVKMEARRVHLIAVLERDQAQLHRERQEYERLRHDAAANLQGGLARDFPGTEVPPVAEIEALLDGGEGPSAAASGNVNAQARVDTTNGVYHGAIVAPVGRN